MRRGIPDGFKRKLPGPPRPNRLKSDGRSPGLRVQAIPILPGPKASGSLGVLAAHSCGGSRGFGGWWLHLTAFPFHPQRVVDADETVALVDTKPILLGKDGVITLEHVRMQAPNGTDQIRSGIVFS